MTLGHLNFRNFRATLSDEQELEEMRTQRRWAVAVKQMRAAIADVNASSVVVEIEPSAFDDFLNDECPSPEYWRAKLEAARHG